MNVLVQPIKIKKVKIDCAQNNTALRPRCKCVCEAGIECNCCQDKAVTEAAIMNYEHGVSRLSSASLLTVVD